LFDVLAELFFGHMPASREPFGLGRLAHKSDQEVIQRRVTVDSGHNTRRQVHSGTVGWPSVCAPRLAGVRSVSKFSALPVGQSGYTYRD
jgi:hypothetical protein